MARALLLPLGVTPAVYAIISDVHASIEALSAVIAEIDREGISDVVCLGDLVGYNASPNECVELLRSRGVRSIAGNHDRAAAGETRDLPATARLAIEWTRAHLHPDHREYLRQLPSCMLIDDCFFVVHGALHPEPNDALHLSNGARVEASLRELRTGRFGSRLCFFGHTHRPIVYQHQHDTRAIDAVNVSLVPDAAYLINPGSVGDPRERDPRASYAVFDVARGLVQLRRVNFDWQTARERSMRAGLVRRRSMLARAGDQVLAGLDRGRDHLASLTR